MVALFMLWKIPWYDREGALPRSGTSDWYAIAGIVSGIITALIVVWIRRRKGHE